MLEFDEIALLKTRKYCEIFIQFYLLVCIYWKLFCE